MWSKSYFRAFVATVTVAVASTAPLAGEIHLIDEEISAVQQQRGITPSGESSGAEFLRRVSLSVIGKLPTPDEVQAFLADDDPKKRARKINELLDHPLHAAMWATRFSEILGNDLDKHDENRGRRRATDFYNWLRQRFGENTPYDELVRRILLAHTRDDQAIDAWIEQQIAAMQDDAPSGEYRQKPTLDFYWLRGQPGGEYPVDDVAERTAAAFLGIRIECARCHQHPFDHWSQNDYRAFTNLFRQVRYGLSPELRIAMVGLLNRRRADPSAYGEPLPRLTEVYVSPDVADARDAETGDLLPPQPLGGPPLAIDDEMDPGADRRITFADWLTAADNPYFAHNIVNRVWDMHFGRGLVDPVDAFSDSNPATHPQLLDRLASDFVAHGYDIRRLERQILNSATWQRTSTPTASNVADQQYYSHAPVQTLSAEVAYDILLDATNSGGEPLLSDCDESPPARAIEHGPSASEDEFQRKFFQVFKRPPRTRTCDCERTTDSSIRRTLLLMSDPAVQQQLGGGRVQSLLRAESSDKDIVDELFLATLSRFPTDFEQGFAMGCLATADDRATACEDILWGLINTREFITNH